MLLQILKQHGSAYFFSKLIPGIVGIISVPIFTRLYGFSNYGQIMILIALSNLVTVCACGWLSQSWIRFQMGLNKLKYIVKAGLYSLAVAVIICLLVLSLYRNIYHSVEILYIKQYVAIILMTIAMGGVYLIQAGLQSSLKSKNVLIIAILLSFLSFLFPLISYFFYPTTTGFIFAYAAAHCVAAGVGIYYFFSNMTNDDHINSNIHQWFKYGFPISIWLSLQAAIPFIERIFIQIYLGSDMLGKYTALSELVLRSFSILLFPITLSIQPIIMKYWNLNKKQISIDLWKQTLKIFIYILVISALLFLLTNQLIIKLIQQLLVSSFKDPLLILTFIGITGFLWQANIIIQKPLELTKRTISMVVIMLFSILLFSIINANIITRYGLIGAAFSSMICAISYGIISFTYGIIVIRQSDSNL
tara:strand:+ start:2859 stop:4112 length:1254 start_codon:yes stop_codon:yes gene_type:complete